MRDRHTLYSWNTGSALKPRKAYGFSKADGRTLEGWIKVPMGAFLVRQYGLVCLSVLASQYEPKPVILTPHEARLAAIKGNYGLQWIEST